MNVVITGGSKGIGRETALQIAANPSNRVIITGRNESALKEVAVRSASGNILYHTIDFKYITDEIGKFVQFINAETGTVDILINNAGLLVNKPFTDLSKRDIREMMEVNFIAPVTLIRHLLPLMKGGAHIINISSMGGFQGSSKFPGLSVYSSSKAALACLTDCLAVEFAEKNISINCIAPGSVDTEMLQEAFPGYRAPVSAEEMGKFLADFAINRGGLFNGRVIPVSVSVP